MKHLLLLLLFLLPLGGFAAEEDSIFVHLKVMNKTTRTMIPKAAVEVMTEDGVVIKRDSTTAPRYFAYYGDEYKSAGGEIHFNVARAGNYLIRVLKEGYDSTAQVITIPERTNRKRTISFTDNLFVAPLRKEREHMLGAATVTATKIKMVHRGDTVVFNADAFELSEGSMLDALLAQMPGMKLEDGGRITYNGKKVESLLVDGKDFFKDDPKIALEQLPAYTVNRVEVYRRDPKGQLILSDAGREMKKELVVDVRLKRQYAQGWMGQAEAAGGTHGRYLMRLFGMRYTDHSRLFAFAAMNNLNDTKVPGSQGSWNDGWTPSGTLRLKIGGVTYNWDRPASGMEYSAKVQLTDERITDESKSAGVNYLSGGDTWTRSWNIDRTQRTHFTASNRFTFKKKEQAFNGNLSLDYTRDRSSLFSRAATFDADPQDASLLASLDTVFAPIGSARLQRALISRTGSEGFSDKDKWSGSVGLNYQLTEPLFGNALALGFQGNYWHNRDRRGNFYSLSQPRTTTDDFQHRYDPLLDKGYAFQPQVGYTIYNRKHSLEIEYSYEQKYGRNERTLYRLDRLGGWGAAGQHALRDLPSTTDSLHRALDFTSSYLFGTFARTHSVNLSYTRSLPKDWTFRFGSTLNAYDRRVVDHRNLTDYAFKKRETHLNPYVILYNWGEKESTHIIYSVESDLPQMHYYLPVMDVSDPLVRQLGNPQLRTPLNHRFAVFYSQRFSRYNQSMNVHADYTVQHNAVGQARTYDRTTGVATYTPQNINGNWDLQVGGGYYRSLDSLGRWMLSLSAFGVYANSADFIPHGAGSIRSSVRRYTIQQGSSLTYTRKGLRLQGNAAWKSINLTSHREGFRPNHAFEFSYGIDGNYEFWNGFEVKTDLTMFSRRGYEDPTMNDNNLVWNVGLSRSFLKEKRLTISLEGYDILGQRSTVSRMLNSQGRTEAWVNSVPRYFLLRLSYKFHASPKK